MSDNETGVLIGAYFNKLKELENYIYILDNVIRFKKTEKNILYQNLLEDFEKAKIVEE